MADQNPPPEENDPVADAFAELAAEEAAATEGSPPDAPPQADLPPQANSDTDAPAQDDSEPGTEPGTVVSADDAATMAEALLADIGAAVSDVNNGIIGESPSPESQSASPSSPPPAPPPPAPIPDGASPMDLPSFDQAVAKPIPAELDMLADVNPNVKIELGRTTMLVEDVLDLSDGAVVELDKLAGDPVDIYVNERRIARGEVLVLNDTFCVRINEIIDSEDIKAG